jgi:hypothetical protein
VAVVGVTVLLLPVQALAAFCFALTEQGTGAAIGLLRVAPGAAAEDFTHLLGQFTNDAAFCDGGGGEAAPGVGQFAVTSATNAHVSFQTPGTTNCFPVDIQMNVDFSAFPTMSATGGTLDITSLASLVIFNAATVDCAGVPVK